MTQNGTNGHGVSATTEGNAPLKVIIVGAGIAGLTAAIALRREGHIVEVYEQAPASDEIEIGAAIHLAPNANGILKRLGVDAESAEIDGVETELIRDFTRTGELTHSVKPVNDESLWIHKWLLVHRAHLHSALKTAAQAPTTKGTPAKLYLSSRAVDVDPHQARITLENGDVVKGDVVIGADGVHSRTRAKLPGVENAIPYSSGKSAFRFLITREEALADEDPETREIAAQNGSVDMWHDGPDRKIVIYSCAGNKLLNFVCVYPDSIHQSAGAADRGTSTWNNIATKESLLDTFNDFSKPLVRLLEKADPKTLKTWQLLDLDELPTWVEGNLVLLGDAAHPFLPYAAAGGAMAIEDAASLAVMLHAGVDRSEIPARLKLYEQARKERVAKVQDATRRVGKHQLEDGEFEPVVNYIYGHDEFDHSTQFLRRHRWSLTPRVYWRQPIVFGPMPGPRQDINGRDRVRPSLKATFKTAAIKFKTSRTVLQNLFPNDSFRFISPGTVAYASFSQTTLDQMDWLGGGGYSHLGLYIHGVQHTTASGQVITGTYMPILFESLADPIVSGREELGMPKLYSAIDVHRREKSYHVTASWQGAVWGHFEWQDLQDQDPNTDKGTIGGESDNGILVYRYLPAVGRDLKGTAEAEYTVFVPHAEDSKIIPSKVHRVRKTTNAKAEIAGLDWTALPTLHHVISRLGEIPIYEVVEGKVVEGEGVPDVSSAKRVD